MPLHALREVSRQPFSEGSAFGDHGPYELVRALADVRLDPHALANRAIADIDRARRGADGSVVMISDVLILRPVDPARGNGGLLSIVPNRGGAGGVPFSLTAQNAGGVGGALVPGDGWLLRQGWTVAWTGWQWEIATGGDLLGCETPDVLDETGAPLKGVVRLQLQPNQARPHLRLNSSGDLMGSASRFYRAAEGGQALASLRVGVGRAPPQRMIAREDWSFATDAGGAPVADREHVWLREGFSPDHGYEVCYETDVCPLAGGGLAAFRDVASHLRHDDPKRPLRFAVAAGWSQSGRFLRQLLLDGLTHDEAGRQVWDGVMPFIAGASRGEFNHRYAQPAEALAPGLGHTPPFDLDGLLPGAPGARPKVMLINTGSEYWRADGSLAHVSLDGARDLPPPPDARIYYLAGTEHIGGAEMMLPLPKANRNWISVAPAYRALLRAMQLWIVEGKAPPQSRLPLLADGTAVSRQSVLSQIAAMGFTRTPPDERLALRREILGEGTDEAGAPAYPIALGQSYPVFVSAVDIDGNEIAGVRLPEVAVPLATHTGWNALLADGPRWDGIAVLAGNSHPFAKTRQARLAADPRLSIEERYGSPEAYAEQVRGAAEHLLAEGFLLAEDIDAVVSAARDRYLKLTAAAE